MLSIVIHVLFGRCCRCVIIRVHKGRLKAQGTGHKEKFEFGNREPARRVGVRRTNGNFEIKESQPKIRNSRLPPYALCDLT